MDQCKLSALQPLVSDDPPVDLSIPAKPLTGDECKMLTEWQEQAPAGIGAYVSQRNADRDLNDRIVVTQRKTRKPSYLIYAPSGADYWIVASAINMTVIGQFPSLRTAMAFVSSANNRPTIRVTETALPIRGPSQVLPQSRPDV